MDSDDGISSKSKIDENLLISNYDMLRSGKKKKVATTDIQGNFMQSNHSNDFILNDEGKEKDCWGNTSRGVQTTEINANTINMLHSMDLSDDEDYGRSHGITLIGYD